MTEQEFPQAKPDDAEDVSLALETAAALWKKGNRDEALRWVRKAADAAEQAGDDMRALTLARAAADLKSAEQGAGASAQGVPEPAQPGGSGTASLPSVAVSLAASASPSEPAPPPRRGSLPPKPTKRALPGIGVPVEEAPDSNLRRPPPPSSVRPGPSASSSLLSTPTASVQPASRQKSMAPGAPPKPKAEAGEPGVGASAATAAATPVAAIADASLSASRAEDTRKSVPVLDAAGAGAVGSGPTKPAAVSASTKPDAPSFPPAPTKASSSARLEAVTHHQAGRANAAGAMKVEAPSIPAAPRKAAVTPSVHASDGARGAGQSVDELPKNLEGGFQVAIKQSARDQELFLVRPLGKGQAPPPGYKVAFVLTPDGSLT